jgi:pimeloyl-ACP methyl ester carboxylesterase
MNDKTNPPDGAADNADAPKPYWHSTATRVVPMQRDHLGRPYWESYHTPASFEVRAECRVPPHMPGVIIFVHGVNSTGEWYDAAEKALCEGLNDRLNRSDNTRLNENRYITTDKQTGKPIPRQLDPQWKGHSPVIRFYWGYRAAPGTERNWRIPLRNPKDFDFWAAECTNQNGPWYWGGGPFQNGTNNLPQLWSHEGMTRHVMGFDLENLNPELDRQLQDAPPRTYYAHAAHRLAKLIDMIRTECPRDTVTIMSHSQGTMVAMAATALCKTRAPDALFVMNSPYALDDKLTDALTAGMFRPTAEARVQTFRSIANRIRTERRVFTDAELKQLQCGASEDMDFWRPDNRRKSGVHERDNHGRLYVYFTPHDRIMGATPLQSIGWQGLPDKLLAELGDTVKQRMLARGTPVADTPGVRKFGTLPPIRKPVPGVKPDAFWNGNRQTPLGELWATPHPDKTVTVNAEQVPHPVTAEEMKTFEDSRVDAREMGQLDRDPRYPNRGKYHDPDYRFYRSVYQPEWRVDANPLSPIGVSVARQTQDEMLQQHDHYHAEPTNHSTVPGRPDFMRRVVAYDLPVGFCDAYEKRALWTKLMKLADWTQGYDAYFRTGVPETVEKPEAIDWDTAGDALNRAALEDLKAQARGFPSTKREDIVYGD